MDGIYQGRLKTDGSGNLLADESRQVGTQTVPLFLADGSPALNDNNEQITLSLPIMEYGPNHDMPVAAHDGSYVFLAPGEPSHNDRHEENRLVVDPTQDVDPELPGFAGNDDAEGVPGTEHHFGALPDDPHYSEGVTDEKGVVTNTLAKHDPDSVAAKVTGHTDAYTNPKEG